MPSKLRLFLSAAVAAALLVPANSVWAALLVWDASVTDVDDGDTFEADIDGDGTTDTPQIRMTGIQAMELTDYSNVDPKGACMAPEAALELMSLIEGKRVKLKAQKDDSTGSRDRLQRWAAVRIDGTWRDVGLMLLRKGLVLWSSNGDEWAKNKEYYLAAKEAREQGVGIWDPNFDDGAGECEVGPEQDALLDMWIQWDADGADGTNVNGEWVRIRNRGTDPVDIGGWTFRDPSLSTAGESSIYTFPLSASIPANSSIQLKVGEGTPVDDSLYFWGQTKPKFENVDYSRDIGDGGYLFDTDGSLRASFMYPCMPRRECTTPLDDKVKVVKANYNPDGKDLKGEYIDIKNVTADKVRLEGYQLEVWPFGYVFGRYDILEPGQVLRLWVKRGTDGQANGRLVRYWGFTDGPILNNSGDWARIKNFEDVQVHCLNWQGKRCGDTG